MKAKKSKLSRYRGQALIEFTLIFPLLMLMMMGALDFGLFFSTYYTVQNAGREGVRLAVVLPNLAYNDPRVISRVDALIPDSNLFSCFDGGISSTGVSDCEVNDQVTVTITGTYDFLFLKIIGINNIIVDIPTTMRYEGC